MTCLLRTCLVPDGPLMWLDCPDVWLAVLCDDEADAARTAGLVHRTEYQAEADRFFSEAFAAATGPPLQGKMLSDVRLVRRLDEVASLLPLRALRGRHGRAIENHLGADEYERLVEARRDGARAAGSVTGARDLAAVPDRAVGRGRGRTMPAWMTAGGGDDEHVGAPIDAFPMPEGPLSVAEVRLYRREYFEMTVMQLGYIPSADAMLEYVAVHRAAEAVQALQRARETAEIPGFWDEWEVRAAIGSLDEIVDWVAATRPAELLQAIRAAQERAAAAMERERAVPEPERAAPATAVKTVTWTASCLSYSRRRWVRGRRRNASMSFLACIARPGLTPNLALMGRRRTTFDLRGISEFLA